MSHPNPRTPALLAAVLAVVAGTVALTGCDGEDTRRVREERTASSVPLGTQTVVRIETRTADVHLTSSPDDTIRVVTNKRVQSVSERSVEALWSQIRVTMEREGDQLVLRVREPERGTTRVKVEAGPWRLRRQIEIDVTVAVPQRAKIQFLTERGDLDGADLTQAVDLDMVAGDADLSRLSGPVTVEATSGSVALHDISADVSVRTTSGDIQAERVKGTVAVRATSGDVSLEAITGRTSIETSTGDIDLRDAAGNVFASASSGDVTMRVRADSLIIETSSGDIDATVLTAPKLVQLKTASGELNAALPKGSGGALDAQTATGTMSIEGAIDITTMNRNRFVGRLGGQGQTMLRTSSGEIRLTSSSGSGDES